MDSLKEWATVVKALEDGKQTVILRKGGILETASGFRIASKKFWLFPTYEHQELKHIKPEFHKYLQTVKNNLPDEGTNIITSFAEVLFESDISEESKIVDLSEFHIWSDEYIEERKQWKPEKPMKAVFLKIYNVEQLQIPLKEEYQGCKSWIDINSKIEDGNPVLNQNEINSKLEKFKEIVS